MWPSLEMYCSRSTVLIITEWDRKISNLNSHIVYLCLTVHVYLTVLVLKWLSVGRHSEFFLSHPGECFLLCHNPWSRERRTWQENQTSSTACIWIRKQFITTTLCHVNHFYMTSFGEVHSICSKNQFKGYRTFWCL